MRSERGKSLAASLATTPLGTPRHTSSVSLPLDNMDNALQISIPTPNLEPDNFTTPGSSTLAKPNHRRTPSNQPLPNVVEETPSDAFPFPQQNRPSSPSAAEKITPSKTLDHPASPQASKQGKEQTKVDLHPPEQPSPVTSPSQRERFFEKWKQWKRRAKQSMRSAGRWR